MKADKPPVKAKQGETTFLMNSDILHLILSLSSNLK